MTEMQPRERIIAALDVPTEEEALRLVEQLSGKVGLFKVGLQLFTALGPRIVGEIQRRGGRIFLDLKLHDIPNTVASAAVEAHRMGVQMLTIHSFGGHAMMSQAALRVSQAALEDGRQAPLLLGVTVLTSLDEEALKGLGIVDPLPKAVLSLARQARQAGFRGVVCSPREIGLLRRSGLHDLTLVTPGIRPAGSSSDDQARVLTPRQAVEQGADYLVIGRPITRAPDPAQAVEDILSEWQDL